MGSGDSGKRWLLLSYGVRISQLVEEADHFGVSGVFWPTYTLRIWTSTYLRRI